ncbi:MAG: protein kinase [Myxococcota bacterium]|nr:protein kinase [Myxococcota bacterium]
MEATESVLRAGDRLDRYELLCPIASGGMAKVWLARLRGKRGFEKLFAVKTIRTELIDDAQFQEMFLDEARIAAAIHHPNVAQILDLGEQDDVLFIVMEWVDGDSLAKIRRLLAKRGAKLPVGIVLRLLADACAGLHAAHELRDAEGEPLQIVHRDVSPHNILLAASGAVKIIDFGIAKAQNRTQGETRTGIVKGKIQYMAPEQVKKGGTVDRRADVWALGMCLHELVAGSLPYGGEDDVGVIRRLMSEEAPAIDRNLPQAIQRVLERSTVLDPDARFPTAAGMQRALEGAMKDLGENSTSHDVASFLRTELPDLACRRREAVSAAIEEARERGAHVESGEEVAFAPTLVGHRDVHARDEGGAIALIQRKGRLGPAARTDSSATIDDSRVVSSGGMLDDEPFATPRRGGLWLSGMLLFVVVAGTAFAAMRPALVTRGLTALGWRISDQRLRLPETPSAAPIAPTVVGVLGVPASAGSNPLPGPSDARATPSAARGPHPTNDAARARASRLHLAAAPAATPGEALDASGTVQNTAFPPAASTEIEDDPSNPYSN